MLEFTKMHGLGNDFVVVDAMNSPASLGAERIRLIADRHRGVGCDQVLLLEPSDDRDTVCRYRVFNADGGEAGQCGNGVRCIALYLVERGLVEPGAFSLSGPAGPVRVETAGDDGFRVDMGRPRLDPAEIPFRADGRHDRYAIRVGEEVIEIAAVSMGNPHAVLLTESVDEAEIARLGPAIERHERFPEHANVGFLQVQGRDRARLRVFERGVGETRACGSGACAAVVAGRMLGLLDERVAVTLPGGTLVIEWNGEGEPVWMTGPATLVFQGILRL